MTPLQLPQLVQLGKCDCAVSAFLTQPGPDCEKKGKTQQKKSHGMHYVSQPEKSVDFPPLLILSASLSASQTPPLHGVLLDTRAID